MSLTLCCLLWAGEAEGLHAYEDAVLALLGDHEGAVVARVKGPGGEHPDEMQLLRFADRSGVDSFMADPRRAAMATERDRVIARTELFEVEPT